MSVKDKVEPELLPTGVTSVKISVKVHVSESVKLESDKTDVSPVSSPKETASVSPVSEIKREGTVPVIVQRQAQTDSDQLPKKPQSPTPLSDQSHKQVSFQSFEPASPVLSDITSIESPSVQRALPEPVKPQAEPKKALSVTRPPKETSPQPTIREPQQKKAESVSKPVKPEVKPEKPAVPQPEQVPKPVPEPVRPPPEPKKAVSVTRPSEETRPQPTIPEPQQKKADSVSKPVAVPVPVKPEVKPEKPAVPQPEQVPKPVPALVRPPPEPKKVDLVEAPEPKQLPKPVPEPVKEEAKPQPEQFPETRFQYTSPVLSEITIVDTVGSVTPTVSKPVKEEVKPSPKPKKGDLTSEASKPEQLPKPVPKPVKEEVKPQPKKADLVSAAPEPKQLPKPVPEPKQVSKPVAEPKQLPKAVPEPKQLSKAVLEPKQLPKRVPEPKQLPKPLPEPKQLPKFVPEPVKEEAKPQPKPEKAVGPKVEHLPEPSFQYTSPVLSEITIIDTVGSIPPTIQPQPERIGFQSETIIPVTAKVTRVAPTQPVQEEVKPRPRETGFAPTLPEIPKESVASVKYKVKPEETGFQPASPKSQFKETGFESERPEPKPLEFREASIQTTSSVSGAEGDGFESTSPVSKPETAEEPEEGEEEEEGEGEEEEGGDGGEGPVDEIEAVPLLDRKPKIQVDPNATLRDLARNKNYLTSLPIVPNNPAPYSPCLYTFRVKAKDKTKKVKNALTKPPPFYLQFDHAIAVIWCLFNPDANKDQLGIVQLQWALHFLETIYNDEGSHPKDVQLCIDAIQDLLISKYAAMSQQACIYTDAQLGDFLEPEEQEKSFSLNYTQLSQKSPVPYGALNEGESGVFIEPIDKQLLEELENVKRVVGIDSVDLTKVVSKEQVMNILEDWKKEQLDKIQEELRLLYVVEDMMKNSDSQNFEGYTDETHFKGILRKN